MQGETNERIKKRRQKNVIKIRKGEDARKNQMKIIICEDS